MELDAEQITKIGIAFNHQFSDLNEQNPPVPVVLFEQNSFLIQKDGENHILYMMNYSELKDVEGPKWLKIKSGDDTQIIFPHSRLSEITYLLRKSFEDWVMDDTQPYFDSVSALLKSQVRVWREEGEPLRPEQQRGLLGEIYALVEIAKLKGPDAIVCWDETSTSPVDFVKEDTWGVESKAKTTKSNSVKISSVNQLRHQGIPLVLSVLDVSKSKSGESLPLIIERKIEELRSIDIPREDIERLVADLDDYYQIYTSETSFTSKWKTGKIKFYGISEDSTPSVFSANIPKKIELPDGYTLIIDEFKAELLENLI
jgi:hypothetical protein